jgi:cytochrome c-type biogenesis protein CcmF
MAALGQFLLLATFVVCSYAAAASVAGARRGSRRLVESGVGAFYLIAALMAVASAVMVNAFLSDDFTIKYVSRYSDSIQPLFYKITAYWGGLDGSIMFWVTLLALFGSLAVYVNRERHRELIPYVVAVIAVVQMFFIFLMMVHNNPFGTYIGQPPADGSGLNPLLQNYWMVIHPPTLYVGFVGMTIPFAFCIAALITGHLDDSWLRAVRRWTMTSWLFLTVGLGLGMIWAYEELGWGGYWGWDPVENAGALPWFPATAFLHSVMVQERRSMLRVWNVSLVIITFFLTIFATFMTRSGIVQSVHAFGEDPELARLFGIFMIALLTFSFGWVIYRLPLLQARNELDSWMSREAAFLVNNWILLFSAFFILFATMFPTISEALTGERITVGPPFFNQWMLPIGLVLLLLTGIGPLLAWRKTTASNLRNQFLWPSAAALAAAGLFVALGFRIWVSGICIALCAFVMGTIVQEFWRGANVRRGATGTDFATALIGLFSRNKRRYGGYVVHAGIVVIFFGFAGNGLKPEELTINLLPGQQTTIGDYTIRQERLQIHDDEQKQSVTAHVSVFRGGQQIDTLYPARWFFHKSQQPTTEAAIRRTIPEDLHIVLGNFDAATQAAHLQINVNPLVNWVWLGFGIMALGTGIALLPERAFAFAVSKLPADAAATTTALLLVLFLGATPVSAQTGQDVSPAAVAPLERQMQGELVCMCGGCKSPLNDCPMLKCQTREQQKTMLHDLVEQGKTHDEVVAAFVQAYGGQDVLGAPIDQGFNRLAWLFPYLVGITGAAAVGLVAVRLSKRRASDEPATADAVDPSVEERLDDELRDLD